MAGKQVFKLMRIFECVEQLFLGQSMLFCSALEKIVDRFARGAFARRPFFGAFVAESLRSAFEHFAAKTGREYASLSRYRAEDAKLLLLAQGAAVETARAAADALRDQIAALGGVVQDTSRGPVLAPLKQ